METWSETSLLKLKVSDLKLELKAIKLPQYGTKLILVQRLLDYKEKIETQQILTSNLLNNQSQLIPTSSSSFSFTSDQFERVSVNLCMINTNNYIVCKNKYQHLISNFQNFINSTNLYFDFGQLKDVVSHVYLVSIKAEYWQWSTCTCPFYQKHYSCSHIISVSTSLNLVKLPAHCKNMIQIGEKTKRGRKPKALKALQTQ